MLASKTIALPKNMPLTELFSEIESQISQWFKSFDRLSGNERDSLRLAKFEQTENEFKYHYSVSLKIS